MPWLIEDVRFWESLEYGKWEGTVLLTLGKDWKSVCPTSTSRITPTSWLCPGCEVWGWQDLRRKWFYGTPERLYLNTWPESSSQSNDSSTHNASVTIVLNIFVFYSPYQSSGELLSQLHVIWYITLEYVSTNLWKIRAFSYLNTPPWSCLTKWTSSNSPPIFKFPQLS